MSALVKVIAWYLFGNIPLSDSIMILAYDAI